MKDKAQANPTLKNRGTQLHTARPFDCAQLHTGDPLAVVPSCSLGALPKDTLLGERGSLSVLAVFNTTVSGSKDKPRLRQ